MSFGGLWWLFVASRARNDVLAFVIAIRGVEHCDRTGPLPVPAERIVDADPAQHHLPVRRREAARLLPGEQAVERHAGHRERGEGGEQEWGGHGGERR